MFLPRRIYACNGLKKGAGCGEAQTKTNQGTGGPDSAGSVLPTGGGFLRAANAAHQLLRAGAGGELPGDPADDSSQIQLDMGRWEVTLYGDGLELCAASRGQLLLQGRVLRTEFSYKEGN